VGRPQLRWEDIKRDCWLLLSTRTRRRIVGDKCNCGELLKSGHDKWAVAPMKKTKKKKKKKKSRVVVSFCRS
jgi:hypothetical protein